MTKNVNYSIDNSKKGNYHILKIYIYDTYKTSLQLSPLCNKPSQ